MNEFFTKNGNKKIKIVPASFKDAIRLKQAAVRCMTETDFLQGLDLSNLSEANELINHLVKIIVALDTSAEFHNAVFACLSNCIYEDFHTISEQLFDDFPDLRQDYYEIVAKCTEVNLLPFFTSLSSELKTRLNSLTPATPEQK